MSLLEECKQEIIKVKSVDMPASKKQLKEIHNIVKLFMKEKNISSFFNVELEDFEKWFISEFQDDTSILIALTSSENKKVMHFTKLLSRKPLSLDMGI